MVQSNRGQNLEFFPPATENLNTHSRGKKISKIRTDLTKEIIGAAIDVHKAIGPGLLESAYEECLAEECLRRGIAYSRQVPLPVVYKNVKLDCGYRLDFLIENSVVLEIKSVNLLQPIHEAQMLTYLKLGGWNLGLLINFNVAILKNGIRRLVFDYPEVPSGAKHFGRLPSSSFHKKR